MSQSTVEQQKRAAVASAASRQTNNIAHALAGAGGGILSMALTCAVFFFLRAPCPDPPIQGATSY